MLYSDGRTYNYSCTIEMEGSANIAWDKKLTCGESLHPHSIEIAAEMFVKLASYSKLKSHAILCISSI